MGGRTGSRSSGFHTAVVSAAIFVSRVAGFVRERLFAHYLGNGIAAGAFRAALRIPNLLQNLFGEGALSASFIPVYARLLAEGREADARRLAYAIGTVLCLVLAILAGVGSLCAPWLVDLVAPGFEGEAKALAGALVTMLFPATAMLAASAWCLGVLNSHRRFLLSYLAPVLWNVPIIAALWFFGARRGSGDASPEALAALAVDVAWAFVVGSLLQLLVQVPTTWRLLGGIRPSFEWRMPEFRKVITNFVPALMTRGVSQVSAYIDQILASFLGAAMVAAIGYAQTLLLLPVSLFGLAVASAELPELSSVLGSAEERASRIRERVAVASRRLHFLVWPSVAAFFLLPRTTVATLFETGRFGPENTTQVAWILVAGSIALLPTTLSRLYASTFWAVGNVRFPANVAIARVSFSAVLGWIAVFPLRERMGWDAADAAAALVAASSVAACVEYLVLRSALRRHTGAWTVSLSFLARVVAAAGGAVALAAGLREGLDRWVPMGPASRGLLVLGAFGVAYAALTLLLAVPEAKSLGAKIWRKLRRR
jgi:putative peptidoglycan lipid II flippase